MRTFAPARVGSASALSGACVKKAGEPPRGVRRSPKPVAPLRVQRWAAGDGLADRSLCVVRTDEYSRYLTLGAESTLLGFHCQRHRFERVTDTAR
jgi:hypothetical protein